LRRFHHRQHLAVSDRPALRQLHCLHVGDINGTVGYIGYNGNIDTCIAIRTIVMKGQTASIQAGAGIVFDSIPDNEYQECLNKSKGMLRAIEIAETGVF
ncbi:MAG: chorismate-binding protein, partial [Candidatus Omnitrophica bacterium]|nr:chorismate-binding protein [Candidatus Omnitrophota bacterium]